MSKDVNEEEEAARVFQVLLRQKKNCPISPFWESHAFTFDQPPEVAAYLTERAGWAALRRRSTVRRTVEDDQGRAWVEQQDSVRVLREGRRDDITVASPFPSRHCTITVALATSEVLLRRFFCLHSSGQGTYFDVLPFAAFLLFSFNAFLWLFSMLTQGEWGHFVHGFGSSDGLVLLDFASISSGQARASRRGY